MLIYFIKSEYGDGIYNISDFWRSPTQMNTYFKWSVSVNFVPSDGSTSIILTNELKNSETEPKETVRDFTHILIPDANKIYAITDYEYVNSKQTRLTLVEDVFISNYYSVRDQDIVMTRSNDASLFRGILDTPDLSVRKTTTATQVRSISPNHTGPWMCFTFQADALEGDNKIIIELNKELQGYPSLGTFATLADIQTAYPDVTTNNPYEVPYYLKFAETATRFYQAVYLNGDVTWTPTVKTGYPYVIDAFNDSDLPELSKITITKDTFNNYMYNSVGDTGTINVLFPMDTTIVYDFNSLLGERDDGVPYYVDVPCKVSVPSYYAVKGVASNGGLDKLMSVKMIPNELVEKSVSVGSTVPRLVNIVVPLGSAPEIYNELQSSYYKQVSLQDTSTLRPFTLEWSASKTSFVLRDIDSNFTNAKWNFDNRIPISTSTLVQVITDYEPFKEYYLFIYGEMVKIPAIYLKGTLFIRLAVTTTDVLYELCSDHYNVLSSGRLMWFSRYSVDKLALFEANNPTYKDQFQAQMWQKALQSVLGSGVTGTALSLLGKSANIPIVNQTEAANFANLSTQGYFQRTKGEYRIGTYNNYYNSAFRKDINQQLSNIDNLKNANNLKAFSAAAGAGLSMINGAVGIGFDIYNESKRRSGLAQVADSIMGQNDIALTWLKGFGLYIVTVQPDAISKDNMQTALDVSGFPVNAIKKISDLGTFGNTVFGNCKIIQGTLIKTVKNYQITSGVNDRLMSGVIIKE